MTEAHPRPVILLVDDNPHDVVLIRLAFRRVGIIDTIHLVKDGIEAMRYIKGEGAYADRHQFPTPTLVLLDLKMPQTSGFDVLEWIREQPALAKVVVVVMSGSKNDADIDRAYALGANSYLIKPTRFEEMVKMMESLKDYTAWARNGNGSNGNGSNGNGSNGRSGSLRPASSSPGLPGSHHAAKVPNASAGIAVSAVV